MPKRSPRAASEKQLWEWLSGAHRENVVDGKSHSETLHMERIENVVGVGNPDVTGCFNGRCFDIELKTVHRPARPTTALIPIAEKDPYIRPAQKNWHRARWRAGGQCYFLVQVGQDDRYLIPGFYARVMEGLTEEWFRVRSLVLSRESPLAVVLAASTYRYPS